MLDQKNLILAIMLSVAILIGFQYLYPTKTREAPPTAPPSQTATGPNVVGGAPAVETPVAGAPPRPTAPAAPLPRDRAGVLRDSPRVAIETPTVRGSIAKVGGAIDDLTLLGYRESTKPQSPNVVLLSPTGAANAYVAKFGWVAPPGVTVPGDDAVWTSDRNQLTPDQPVTLTWDNGAGLVFSRTIAVDRDYMFEVTQRVRNTGTAAATVYPFSFVARTGEPHTLGFFILHEGGLGVLDGSLSEESYSTIKKRGTIERKNARGWLGFTDKYWLAAVIPDQARSVTAAYRYIPGEDRYRAEFRHDALIVEPGATVEVTDRLFAGAKVVRVIDGYAEKLGISRFDLAIDWGWFFFLTKPLFLAIRYFNEHLGNFGLAILLLTVIVKIAFFPLANKSYRAMSKMKVLAPEMKKLQERHKDDRQRLQQEMMALYRKEGANPLAGCLPIVVQIPVFFALYKVLFVTIEMRHAPFYGWISDLSELDPLNLFELFGLVPWGPPVWLPVIGLWPLIMGVTMYLQQKINPQPTDPIQARIFMLLPIFFTFLLASFPAGLVIYWTWNNILSIGQQWIIMRQSGVKNPIAN
jgi:YidC/Oxa1 family membrane protein insertase